MLAGTLIVACTNPLDEREIPAVGGEPAEATITNVSPMDVVTPTPFDPSQATAEPTATLSPQEVPESYVVAEGDTLYGISARFNVDLAALVEANNLSDPNDIQVGQELAIPRPDETE